MADEEVVVWLDRTLRAVHGRVSLDFLCGLHCGLFCVDGAGG